MTELQSSECTDGAASRRVLLCAIGMSPQIVTETLYALAVKPGEGCTPWIPTEVHIVTTARGADNAKLNLLSGTPGWFGRLQHDFGLPPIAFEPRNVHVIEGADGRALEDIRTPADNEAAADQIAELVRQLTQDDQAQLHASLAGGRKTMSYYLGYALSLYGRPDDRLSHVLVNEPFEAHPDFYYPTPYEHVIHSRAPASPQAMNCADAIVQLAEIPFVRLRDGLPERLRSGRSGFTETVDAANRALGPAHVKVLLQSRRVFANGTEIKFNASAFALYAWLARRQLDGRDDAMWSSLEDGAEFLQFARVLYGNASSDFEQIEKGLNWRIGDDDGRTVAGYFGPLSSRDVGGVLNRDLGEAQARRFAIVNVGSRGDSRYRLAPDLEIEVIDRA